MWKLSWFLRDFGYDAELLGKNEIDDKALIDLWGLVKVSEVTVHGISCNIIPTCTAWFRPAAWHPTNHAGSLVGLATSFRRRCSAACSVARCWPS